MSLKVSLKTRCPPKDPPRRDRIPNQPTDHPRPDRIPNQKTDRPRRRPRGVLSTSKGQDQDPSQRSPMPMYRSKFRMVPESRPCPTSPMQRSILRIDTPDPCLDWGPDDGCLDWGEIHPTPTSGYPL